MTKEYIAHMNIKNNLTIIIPSKNESRTLYDCVYNISKQTNINGTRVIISDVSDTYDSLFHIRDLIRDFNHLLNIEVIKGGYPSEARFNGSILVDTPYMLFLDADVFLTNPIMLDECLKHHKDLITVPFYTDYPYRWVFRVFDLFQRLSILAGTPFAIGGFQLWNTRSYWKAGGYNPLELFAEDYSLSKKVNVKEFKILNISGIYTSPRRFKSKGIFWMFQIMVKAYINRNNPEFFRQSHKYWD